MGLDVNGIRFLLYAKKLGANFARSAMIGRQTLHLSPLDLQANLSEFGFAFDPDIISRIFNDSDRYAETFLRFVGAETVHSFDKSDYEGATCLHDMNEELPDRFQGKYSIVLDSGSLEHVFNFPMALRNCMRMVEAGGHYLAITPANNFMGHGFYQFSPELFFDIFSAGSGYELIRVMAYEDKPRAPWFSVKNPASIGNRVTLTNCTPTYLLVMARKAGDKDAANFTPQQSDYLRVWKGKQGDFNQGEGPLLGAVERLIPRFMKPVAKRIVWHLFGYDPRFARPRDHFGFDRRFFQPIDPVRDGTAIAKRKRK